MNTTVLKAMAAVIFVGMLGATIWASNRIALWTALPAFMADPWAVATLCDAYSGFIIFGAWVLWRDSNTAWRFAWLVVVMLAGNIATSLYLLVRLFGLKSGEGIRELLLGCHATGKARA